MIHIENARIPSLRERSRRKLEGFFGPRFFQPGAVTQQDDLIA
jgi:hypothetical protein